MADFICTVCGKTVSKRQSLAHNGGRACKDHPEVMDATQRRLVDEENKRLREIQRRQPRPRGHTPPYDTAGYEAGLSCWCCHKKGMAAQEHHLMMMVASRKVHAEGGNILEPDVLAKAYQSFNPKPVLVLVKVPENHDIVRKSMQGRMFHQLTAGHMLVCMECAKKTGAGALWESALYPEISEAALRAGMNMAIFLDGTLPGNEKVPAVSGQEVSNDVQNGEEAPQRG
jgi:hypothetical protein